MEKEGRVEKKGEKVVVRTGLLIYCRTFEEEEEETQRADDMIEYRLRSRCKKFIHCKAFEEEEMMEQIGKPMEKEAKRCIT